MCGRFTLTAGFQQIIDRFDIQVAMEEKEYQQGYNIAPTDSVVAVVNDGTNNRMGFLKWGLIPSWADDEKVGSRMINARAESAAEKPSFKQSFKKRRCLIVADSFYEWKKTDEGKLPMRIKLKSDELFAMAGIWDTWTSPSGEAIHTCSILTTEPNELMSSIHNRMPVILKREDEKTWVDPSLDDPEKLKQLLKPYPDGGLEAYQVSKKVNSPKNKSKEVIEQV